MQTEVIIVFDGVCNLCSSGVQFVLQHEREAVIKFAPVQSETGKRLLEQNGLCADDPDSFLLIEDDRVYMNSDASLRVARYLKSPWRWAYALYILPRFIRDAAYRTLARNRYRWFGKKDACMVPTPELHARFLK
jgi:predicted DCC family thiol-disulfide oxidoreductase YuxK